LEGQVAAAPSQLSWTSQTPADARHRIVSLPSDGQATSDPVQVSWTSQTPPDARQSVPAATREHAPAPLQKPLAQAPAAHSPSMSAPDAT
jgi:hypothetical protein